MVEVKKEEKEKTAGGDKPLGTLAQRLQVAPSAVNGGSEPMDSKRKVYSKEALFEYVVSRVFMSVYLLHV